MQAPTLVVIDFGRVSDPSNPQVSGEPGLNPYGQPQSPPQYAAQPPQPYQQPAYQQPAYQQPAYTQPGYRAE